MRTELCKHFVLRTGAIPLTDLDCLKFGRTVRTFEGLFEIENWFSDHREALEEDLFREVKRAHQRGSPATARVLLQIKRDVHNQRFGKAAGWPGELPGVSPSIRSHISTWTQRCQAHSRLKRQAQAVFADEVCEKRSLLKELLKKRCLQNGILLANIQLFAKLRRYLEEAPGRLNKRQRQTEATLLQYVYRTAIRATPFATFVDIAPGLCRRQAPLLKIPSRAGRRSAVKFNLRLLAGIEEALAARPEVRAQLQVRLNRTLRLKDGRLLYIHCGDRRRNAVQVQESLMTLKPSPTVLHICRLLQEGGKTFQELSQALAGLNPKAEQEKIEAYLGRLIEEQLLELDFGLPAQAVDPLPMFLKELSRISSPSAEMARKRLSAVRDELDGYAGLAPRERAAAVERIHAHLKDLCRDLDLGIPPLKRGLFYEDSVLCSRPATLSLNGLREIAVDLQRLSVLLQVQDSRLAAQQKMAQIFKKHYGSGNLCPDVFEFFNLYQTAKKDESESEAASEDDLFSAKRLRAARVRLGGLLCRSYLEAAERGDFQWEFDLDRAEAELQPWIGRIAPGQMASNVFAQLFHCGDGIGAMINAVTPGWGKFLSRFALLFDQDSGNTGLPAQMRRFAERCCPDSVVLCDVPSSFSFNGNLRPEITAFELDYPGIRSNRPADSRISLDDLELHHDPAYDSVQLFSKRLKKQVVPLHLGFLTPKMLPACYRFLCRFGPDFGGWPIEREFNKAVFETSGSTEEGVRFFPRISLGRLVLRRAHWNVEGKRLAFLQRQSDDWELFWKTWRFWKTHRLPAMSMAKSIPAAARTLEDPEPAEADRPPEEAYPTEGEEQERPAEGRQPDRGRRKGINRHGQFVDVESFFSVALLSKRFKENADLSLEEMLPSRDSSVVRMDGQPYAGEFIFEFAYPSGENPDQNSRKEAKPQRSEKKGLADHAG